MTIQFWAHEISKILFEVKVTLFYDNVVFAFLCILLLLLSILK